MNLGYLANDTIKCEKSASVGAKYIYFDNMVSGFLLSQQGFAFLQFFFYQMKFRSLTLPKYTLKRWITKYTLIVTYHFV